MEVPLEPFRHPALFYRGDAEYLAGIIPFVLEGLLADEPVAVAVPRPKLDLVEAELGEFAPRVRLIDMNEAGRNPGRILPGFLLAFADEHPGPVRLVGEPIWPGRSGFEYPACVQHEALINRAFAGRDVTVLCPYDAAGLARSVLDDAARSHPALRNAQGERPSVAYAPDALFAEYNLPLPSPEHAGVFRFDLGSLAAARTFTRIHAERAGLRGDRLRDLVLAGAELCANSVVHGAGHGVVQLWRQHDQVVCEVVDHGVFGDPLAGRRPALPGQLGGRGLLLVNQLADLVRLHRRPDGTTTRTFFRVSA
ncbi:sensor histidine kinase [Amycolatopsis sp. H20-H5]|uniref:sensor histidine kinase n=1 Tax=Amycolatopsis sp. H20-H5 TaxID=3046309 RepID=UPI002DB600BD|nr:sensor histidine kinase [Amycolatopsis sp. H20-H5]MEC3979106.1 sensor histidine kinase [Amycolatopsis sp. H20-H5]